MQNLDNERLWVINHMTYHEKDNRELRDCIFRQNHTCFSKIIDYTQWESYES